GERERRLRVVSGPAGKALHEEAQTPKPFADLRARAEEKRSILASEPAQDLARRGGIRPRFGMADRDLTAVGEARLQRGFGLPIDYRNLVPGAREIPRAGRADDAGSENDHSHARLRQERQEPLRFRIWTLPRRSSSGA